MNNPVGYVERGLIGFTDKGEYNANETYVKNDLVSYGGVVWKCLVDDTSGVTPQVGNNWSVFVEAETDLSIISDAFSNTKSYAVGDYAIYNDVLYKFTTAKAAGVWDASKVQATTVADEIIKLNGNFSNKYSVVEDVTRPLVDVAEQHYNITKAGYYLIVSLCRVFNTASGDGSFPTEICSYEVGTIDIFATDPVSSEIYYREYCWVTLVSMEYMDVGDRVKFFRIIGKTVNNFDVRTRLYWLGN